MQHQTTMTEKIKYGELKLSLSNKVNKGKWVYTASVMSVLVTAGVRLATFLELSASCFILS
jgi:hypothetical protein